MMTTTNLLITYVLVIINSYVLGYLLTGLSNTTKALVSTSWWWWLFWIFAIAINALAVLLNARNLVRHYHTKDNVQ